MPELTELERQQQIHIKELETMLSSCEEEVRMLKEHLGTARSRIDSLVDELERAKTHIKELMQYGNRAFESQLQELSHLIDGGQTANRLMIASETEQLKAEVIRLRDGLKKYGVHIGHSPYKLGCNCGLAELLK